MDNTSFKLNGSKNIMDSSNDKKIARLICETDLSNTAISKKLNVNRAKVWRIRKDLTEVKFSSKITPRQKIPFSREGFEGKADIIKDEKGNTEKIKLSHAAGPLFANQITIKPAIMGHDVATYDNNIVENWEPNMFLAVVDDNTGKPLSAAQINSKRNDNWFPSLFANPMQNLDYIILEALSRSTIGGSIFQSLVKFLIGTGFRPELELINPGDDSTANQREIDANKEIVQNLLLIDQQLTVDKEGSLDVSFTEKISALILNTLIFNRSALIFGFEQPIKIGDKMYKNIPSSVKFAHARDLGIIRVSQNHRLEAVQWINASDMIPVSEMIYLWNPLASSKTRNSWFYGDSLMLPMIDALRVVRKNIGVNFLAMAETSYAGRGVLSIAPQGSTEGEKETEYRQITKNLSVPATTHLLLEDPINTRFDNIDYNAKVTEFSDLNESLIKYCIATLGLPHSMFYDESASNRATLIGKIQLATATVINPMREWIGRSISDQWYDRWFREIYADKPEILKKFRIKMVFDDLHVTEWFDNVDAALELDGRKQLKDSKLGEMIGLQNYSDMVETDAETVPGGASGNSMQIGDQKLTMKDKIKTT